MKNTSRYSFLSAALLSVMGVSVSAGAAAKDWGAPVANAAERAQIVAGMSAEQVKQVLGEPAGVMTFARTSQRTWNYFALDTRISKDAQFYVNFSADGKVASTQLVDPGTN